VVGDGDVATPELARGGSELLEVGARVARRGRVHVQVTEQITLLDEPRQPALLRSLDLARRLAELRRDEG
jgi:hypothetical protein